MANFCSECGTKLTGSGAFCPNCGAKQSAPALQPVTAPIPQPVPVPVPVPVPAPVPQPVVKPEPAPQPVPAPAPVVKPEPAPQPVPAPAPVVKPAPAPQPVPAPAPVVKPEPAPQPVPAPTPVVKPAPAPQPVPAPAPVVKPAPAPQPVPAPAPVVKPAPAPQPVVKPAPMPAYQPAPAAPATSLAKPKSNLSIVGLILAVFALLVTLAADVLWAIPYFMESSTIDPLAFIAPGAAWVVPLFALIAVLARKRPLALASTLFAILILVVQMAIAVIYQIDPSLISGSPILYWTGASFLSTPLLDLLNGFSFSYINWPSDGLTLASMAALLNNIFAMFAGLMVVAKKQAD